MAYTPEQLSDRAEILDVVNQGQKEGIVDQQEKEMIESVIEFRDTHAGQIMTARPEIVGDPGQPLLALPARARQEPLERPAALKLVKATQMLVLHEFRRYVRIPVITEDSVIAGKEQFGL